MGSGNTLSNGNLTVVSTSNSAIRATHGKTAGKWYWEVKRVAGVNNVGIGVSNKTFPVSSISLANTNWRGFYGSNGYKWPESTQYSTSTVVGDIVGIVLDLDIGTLGFYKNGAFLGVSHTNVKELGEVYPILTFGTTDSKSVTINFGATSFEQAIPKGYYSYDGNQSNFNNKILLSSGGKTYSLTPLMYKDETTTPKMTSNTAPSGRAFASSVYNTSVEPWLAFDRSDSFYMSASSGGAGHLGYEFNNSISVGKYSVRSANVITRSPKDWTFEGSNDGINWDVLDTQTNQTWTAINTDKEYVIDTSRIKGYKMYRLNWTANGGNTYTSIGELKQYEIIPQEFVILPNQSEQTFLNHGIESAIAFARIGGMKSIVSDSTTLNSGKTFEHTIDTKKRRVDKITLG